MNDQNTVIIDNCIRAELENEVARTGVGPTKLLKNTRSLRPEGLNASIISNWINGNTKTLKKAHLEFVLSLWQSLPDGAERTEITPRIRNELLRHSERTGVGSHAITTTNDDCPEGLTSGIIQYWLDGKIKSAKQEYLDYAIRTWEQLPDK